MIVLLCYLTLLSCVNGLALPDETLYRLDIIHYNDFHARFEETTSADSPTCVFDDNACIGGFARLYYAINKLREEKPEAVVLNAGDSFQGTYWYTMLKWNVTQAFMNLIPHDAHTLGNHEFDDGVEGLVPYLQHLNSSVVVANMDITLEPTMQGLFQPHIIVSRNARNIGIIGLITTATQTSSSPGKVKFHDPIEAARREAEILHRKGVDIIVVLSHCGIEVDKQIAREVGEYIDIIVGGHSHTLLWNGEAPEPFRHSHENVEGPYPVFMESSKYKNHEVIIVQASAFSKYVGNLSVYFDSTGNYIRWDGGPIYLNRSIPEDKNVLDKLQPYANIVHKSAMESFAFNVETMEMSECFTGECPLANIIVDAYAEYCKSKTGRTCLTLLQRGNIRSSLPKGTLTREFIVDVLPFNKSLVAFEIQGQYLRQALEKAVADRTTNITNFFAVKLLHVSDSVPLDYASEGIENAPVSADTFVPIGCSLQVRYDMKQPEGRRIESMNVIDKGVITPLNNDQTYLVVAPMYLADGGDGFEMLKENSRNRRIIGNDLQAVEEYIGKMSIVIPRKDGRMSVYTR